MSCQKGKWKRMLSLYEAGLLDDSSIRNFESHILECPDCADELYDMMPVIESIGEMETPFIELAQPAPLWRIFSFRWTAVVAFVLLAVTITALTLVVIPNLKYLPQTMPSADLSRIFMEMEQRNPEYDDPALLEDPNFSEALKLYQENNLEDCLLKCDAILKKGRSLSGVVLLAARCHLRLKETHHALTLLTQYPVSPQDPNFQEYLFLKARSLLGSGHRQAAVNCFKKLVSLKGPYIREAERVLNLLENQ